MFMDELERADAQMTSRYKTPRHVIGRLIDTRSEDECESSEFKGKIIEPRFDCAMSSRDSHPEASK